MKKTDIKETLAWITLCFAIILLCFTVSFAQTAKGDKLPGATVVLKVAGGMPQTTPGSDLKLEPMPLHPVPSLIPDFHRDTVHYVDPFIPKDIYTSDPGGRLSQGPGIGVENLAAPAGTLEIFPNPNNGQFTLNYSAIHGGNLKIRMMDITGKEIFVQDLNGFNGSYTNPYDFTATAKGIYIVSIEQNNQVTMKKVVIN